MHLESFKVSIPLKKKFTVSKGETAVKTNVITVLNNEYTGEAAGSVHYGPTPDEMQSEIARGMKMLESTEKLELETLRDIDKFDIHPTAKSALIGMVLNYLSGESKRYPWEILSLASPVGIKSSMTIGIEKPDKMIESIRKSEYPIIKIKMGNEEDVLILDVLGKVREKTVRVDANGAWSCAKAEEMIQSLASKNVRLIEQPTGIEFVSEWPHLKGKNEKVELIMDEGLNSLEDYKKYAEFIDGVNIKMEKCGGILEAIRIAEQAHKDNKKVMLGCMVESSIGIAQSVYASSHADYCDLDGPLLLENDIARGISYDRESIAVDREIIGGPKLKRDILKKYIEE